MSMRPSITKSAFCEQIVVGARVDSVAVDTVVSKVDSVVELDAAVELNVDSIATLVEVVEAVVASVTPEKSVGLNSGCIAGRLHDATPVKASRETVVIVHSTSIVAGDSKAI